MTRQAVGSATAALTRSLLVGLTLLWLVGVVGSGFVLKRLIDVKSDDEMQESGAILMSLIRQVQQTALAVSRQDPRSEERRAGKERSERGRSRWTPYH